VSTDVSAVIPAPLQECVDAAWRLGRERDVVSAATLARRLGITGDTATERLQTLERLGLLVVDGAARVALTPAGERLARGLLRKHRLLERLFTDVLALPWERVHEEASRLTSALSDDAAGVLGRLLGHPTSCPHGNAIPSDDDDVVDEHGQALSVLTPGCRGAIIRIEREEPELLKYLATLGLLPGTPIEVEEVAPLGGPVLVRVGSARYALGRNVAARIVVAPES
jgi:DtxR family transcriptional regulator, Mn-dependent transcriptional regulator